MLATDKNIPVHLATGDPVLDALITPGFAGTSDSPPSILVRGGSGVGKSLFSLQCAINYLNDHPDTHCLYYALAESPLRVLNRIQTFFQKSGVTGVLVKGNQFQTAAGELINAEDLPKKVILISNFSYEINGSNISEYKPIHERVDALHEILQQVAVQLKAMRPSDTPPLIVIDPFDVVVGRVEERVHLAEVLRSIPQANVPAIWIDESDLGNDLESFITDYVIDLRIKDIEVGRRTILIRKARDMRVDPIEMEFEITDQRHKRTGKQAVYVIPTLTAVSRHFLKLVKQRKPKTQNLQFGITELDEDLASMLPTGSKSAKCFSLQPAEQTLVIGQDGTRKTFLAVNFLRRNLIEGGLNMRARYLVLREGPHNTEWTGQSITGGKVPLQQTMCRFHLKESDVRLDYISIYKRSAGWVLYSIYQQIVQYGLRLVVISDLSRLTSSLSKNDAEQFVELLTLICRKLQVTALFLSTEEEPERVLSGPTSTMFDNIILSRYYRSQSRSMQEQVHGPTRLGISVRRAHGVPIFPARLHELEFDPSLNGVPLLQAPTGVFRGLVETEPGVVAIGPMTILYYQEDTPGLQQLAVYHEKTVTASAEEHIHPGINVRFEHFPEPGRPPEMVMSALQWMPPFSRHGSTHIVTLDEFWPHLLFDKGTLIPLSRLDPSIEWKRYYRKLLDPVTEADDADQHYAVPFYANTTVLVYRKDILARLFAVDAQSHQLITHDGTLCNDRYSWEDLRRLYKRVCDHFEDAPEHGLIIDDNCAESLSTFTLELIWNQIFPQKCLHNKQKQGMICLDGKELDVACHDWNALFADMDGGTHGIGGLPSFNFLFMRTWYTRYLALACQPSGEQLAITGIPTLPIAKPSVCSISGSWYLGVVQGSMNPHRAIDTIKQMTSFDANMYMLNEKAAVPTYRQLWDDKLVDPTFVKLFDQAISRYYVKGYTLHAPLLASFAHDVLLPTKELSRARIEQKRKEISLKLNEINSQC